MDEGISYLDIDEGGDGAVQGSDGERREDGQDVACGSEGIAVVAYAGTEEYIWVELIAVGGGYLPSVEFVVSESYGIADFYHAFVSLMWGAVGIFVVVWAGRIEG